MRSYFDTRFIGWIFIASVGQALAAYPSSASAAEAGSPWTSLLAEIDVARAPAGTWKKTDDGLRVAAAPSARVELPATASPEYDLRISFTRHTGRDSIALLFPHGKGQAAYEVDAWGLHLAGIQNIGSRDIRNNVSRRNDTPLVNGRRYTMLLEVRKDQVRGLLDGNVVTTYAGDGSELALSNLWTLSSPRALGLGAWESETTFHSVEFRAAGGSSTPAAVATTKPVVDTPTTTMKPAPTTVAKPQAKPGVRPSGRANYRGVAAASNTGKKRVLIVIANHHFFYREYADPRAALESAGIEVTVAAGQRAPCRPHPNSGQSDAGVVQPDLALADVKSANYDAILFSGGWGASAYQFAFNGRYDDAAYNGYPNVKTGVNRLIGEFIAQDKYLCGICNGVSVLAWARVNDASPLLGKRICAPPGPAAPGIYDGQRAQPSSRWHPEANGAVIAPAGSIGVVGNTTDDVLVDGKIITAEDDYSAREAGRRLAQLLIGN
ncbi:MAG: DJ-1/PfpI family protein [Planctomycetia bacterium]|nr:DJ-1/PfpI family protein [Planctomycetia bacterium]